MISGAEAPGPVSDTPRSTPGPHPGCRYAALASQPGIEADMNVGGPENRSAHISYGFRVAVRPWRGLLRFAGGRGARRCWR